MRGGVRVRVRGELCGGVARARRGPRSLREQEDQTRGALSLEAAEGATKSGRGASRRLRRPDRVAPSATARDREAHPCLPRREAPSSSRGGRGRGEQVAARKGCRIKIPRGFRAFFERDASAELRALHEEEPLRPARVRLRELGRQATRCRPQAQGNARGRHAREESEDERARARERDAESATTRACCARRARCATRSSTC